MTPPRISRRAIAETAAHIALGYAQAGVREVGGNNRGDQVEFFQHLMGGKPGDPWCADIVCTCLVKGFARLTGRTEDREHLPGDVHDAGAVMVPLSGFCPALAKAAVGRFCFREPDFTPTPGDLVLFDFLGQGEPHHVGFVRSVPRPDLLLTVEGNTSSGLGGSQADGDGVFCRQRPRGHVFGFVHWG